MKTIDQKDLPYDHEAERSVLGAILHESQSRDNGRFFDICIQRQLVPEAFHDSRNREVYRAMRELDNEKKPFDQNSVIGKLRDAGRLDAIGGGPYVSTLIDAAPVAAVGEIHLNTVMEKYKLRQQIRVCEQSIDACLHNAAVGSDFLRSQAESALLNITSAQNTVLPWNRLVAETAQELDEISHRDKPVLEGLPTGLKDLDAKMLGLRPGEMVVIAARPSVGKTSLAMNIAENVATTDDAKHPVLVFSLEMPAKALAKRMIAGRARVNLHKLNRCLLSNDKLTEARTNFGRVRDELAQAPIYVDDTSALEISELFSRARRYVRQKGIELIVVDYLQLCCCRDAARQGGPYAEITAISQQLKAMAKFLRIPVIVLSQLSRDLEKRAGGDAGPRLSDLRGSGAIEQDADVVLFINRPQKDLKLDREDAVVNVAKNRNGETGEVALNFEAEYTRFSNR